MINVLTNILDGRSFGELRQNSQPGLKLRKLKAFRSCAPKPRDFLCHFSMAGTYGRVMAAVSFGTVVSTCTFPVTKIETLAPGLLINQRSLKMANNTTNPPKNPFIEPLDNFGNIEYKIRCASRLLLDLTNPENEIDPNSLDYIACAIQDHTKELSQAFNDIHDAYIATREAVEASQGDRRAV